MYVQFDAMQLPASDLKEKVAYVPKSGTKKVTVPLVRTDGDVAQLSDGQHDHHVAVLYVNDVAEAVRQRPADDLGGSLHGAVAETSQRVAPDSKTF
jgi:hypothetical protein